MDQVQAKRNLSIIKQAFMPWRNRMDIKERIIKALETDKRTYELEAQCEQIALFYNDNENTEIINRPIQWTEKTFYIYGNDDKEFNDYCLLFKFCVFDKILKYTQLAEIMSRDMELTRIIYFLYLRTKKNEPSFMVFDSRNFCSKCRTLIQQTLPTEPPSSTTTSSF